MKKNLLLCLLLFYTTFNFSQISTDRIENVSLDVVYTSIRNRGLERCIDIDTLTLTKNGYPVTFREMKLVDSLEGNKVGLTRWIPQGGHYDGVIFVTKELLKDINILEEVVAHECGHLWGLSHPCDFCGVIMAGITRKPVPGTSYYYNRFIDRLKVRQKWDVFFKKLTKQNEYTFNKCNRKSV